ncbi:hypothetical protein QWZ16_15295 [Vibrio ostreicida]|uniref:Transposase n=1 Tax=Vibrio ostreicida TaxID=526588 RepID=A0ABT8BXA9_9VIBR|nr:hypothetical protein [Vibrio ostreicida]MDN3611039.1 hypothetical protein [Vibrio ostreicida]
MDTKRDAIESTFDAASLSGVCRSYPVLSVWQGSGHQQNLVRRQRTLVRRSAKALKEPVQWVLLQ